MISLQIIDLAAEQLGTAWRLVRNAVEHLERAARHLVHKPGMLPAELVHGRAVAISEYRQASYKLIAARDVCGAVMLTGGFAAASAGVMLTGLEELADVIAKGLRECAPLQLASPAQVLGGAL